MLDNYSYLKNEKNNMRYIIVSKATLEGKIGSDAQDFNKYHELGWEMVTTRFMLNRMKNEGKIGPGDIVVTQRDRMFLYENNFSVMAFDDFVELEKRYVPESIDLVRQVQLKGDRHTWNDFTLDIGPSRKYKFMEEDRELNTTFEKADIMSDEPYVCLSIRKRGHESCRNMRDEYANNLIKEIKKYINKIYVVGKGCESFEGTQYVTLQEYATLCNSEKCVANIGSVSGAMFIPTMFSKAKYNIIIDINAGFNDGVKRGDPLFMANCVRYTDSEYIILDSNDELNLEKYLKLN